MIRTGSRSTILTSARGSIENVNTRGVIKYTVYIIIQQARKADWGGQNFRRCNSYWQAFIVCLTNHRNHGAAIILSGEQIFGVVTCSTSTYVTFWVHYSQMRSTKICQMNLLGQEGIFGAVVPGALPSYVPDHK